MKKRMTLSRNQESIKAAGCEEFAAECARLRAQVEPWLKRGGRLPFLSNSHLRLGAGAYQTGGGKRLRPILLLLSCGACDGAIEAALPAAAAVELFHTWSLIHDDIIDRDELRRGKPTVHKLITQSAINELRLEDALASHYGLSIAILAGDAVHGAAVDLLTMVGSDDNVRVALVRRMERYLLPGLLGGEAEDVRFSLLPFEQVSEAKVLRMLYLKTGLLMEYSAWAGATIALGDANLRHPWSLALRRAAGEAGLAFQLQDDLLGIIGDERTLGKPVGSDLREGKRTPILLHALANTGAAERARLKQLVGNRDLDSAGVKEAVGIIERAGGIAYGRKLAESYQRRSLARLSALPSSRARELLASWIEYVVGREK